MHQILAHHPEVSIDRLHTMALLSFVSELSLMRYKSWNHPARCFICKCCFSRTNQLSKYWWWPTQACTGQPCKHELSWRLECMIKVSVLASLITSQKHLPISEIYITPDHKSPRNRWVNCHWEPGSGKRVCDGGLGYLCECYATHLLAL